MKIATTHAPLQRITHKTLHERVYQLIRQNLILGHFHPGEILTIRDLATQLGTSVMPVREALHKLTLAHILELTPARSVRVPILSPEKFADICEARVVLEGALARLAARNATAEDIERIETLNDEFSAARKMRDPKVLQQKNREFHFAIYSAAVQETMLELVEPLWVRCGPGTLAVLEQINHEPFKSAVYPPHRAIIEALRLRRPSRAEEAITADIRGTSDRYRQYAEGRRVAPVNVRDKPVSLRAFGGER